MNPLAAPTSRVKMLANSSHTHLPFFVLSPSLPKKKDPQGRDEKEAKPVSHLDVVSPVNKAGFTM